MADLGQCRSCGAPIVWAITPKGARAPLCRDPLPEGDVLPCLPLAGTTPAGGLPRLAVTITGDILDRARAAGIPLYLNHFANCPNRERHKRQTDTPTLPEASPDDESDSGDQ